MSGFVQHSKCPVLENHKVASGFIEVLVDTMHYALFDESGNDQELVPGFEIVLESAAVVDEDLGNLRESELVSV